METSKAKEYLYKDMNNRKIYIAKDLYKILELTDNELFFVYAVIDTPNGEKLFEMDYSYSGEPIVMRVLIHKDYYMKAHRSYKVINL